MTAENDKTPEAGRSVCSDGRDPLELFEARSEALRELSGDELDTLLTASVDQSRAAWGEVQQEAAARRAERYRHN